MIMRTILAVLCLVSGLSAGELFHDDFSRFPPRIFSEPVKQLTNALHEYHFVAHRGVPLDPWANAMIHDDSWCGGDEDGKTYVEMNVPNAKFSGHFAPTLIIGDPEWSDYTVEVKVRPLLMEKDGGVIFRYHTNRHHYYFSLEDGKTARLRLRLPFETKMRKGQWKELGKADFTYDPTRYYTLKVENEGPSMRAYVDGKLLISASDGEILKGKAGIAANTATRFTDFRVTASDATEKAIKSRIAARETELARLRADNPKPKLWKKFAITNYGAGRNVRFGDLDGDGVIDMLIAQNVRKASKNSFDHISCLTAVTFDGKVLWQIGRPDPLQRRARQRHAVPDLRYRRRRQERSHYGDGFQNPDPGGHDRQAEAVGLDAESSRRQRRAPLRVRSRRFHHFLNLDGSKRPEQILIKDRYRTFWVFNKNLKLLWSGNAPPAIFLTRWTSMATAARSL